MAGLLRKAFSAVYAGKEAYSVFWFLALNGARICSKVGVLFCVAF